MDAFGRNRAVTHADLGAFSYAEAVVKESLRLCEWLVISVRVCTVTCTVCCAEDALCVYCVL